MDVASSHSSGTGPIVHYELPTVDALEAKLVVERDSASALRDEVDTLRKQTSQSQHYKDNPYKATHILQHFGYTLKNSQ